MTPEQAGTIRALAALLAVARVRVYAIKHRILFNNETPANTELRRQRAQKAFDDYLDSLTISQGDHS